MKTTKGLLHVHSKFSYDGEHSLEEIARFAKSRGCSFVGMTEHADTFDSEIMSRFVRGCEEVSDHDFLMIPGLEFACEGDFHVLGLGIESFRELKKTQEVIQFIHAQKGFAVLAHPGRYGYQIPPALLAEVDGVEIWSATYDGRYVPNPRTIKFFQEQRKGNGCVIALGGEDLHKITNLPKVEIRIACAELNKEAILREFKKGHFEISNRWFRLSSSMENKRGRLAGLAVARVVYDLVKKGRAFLRELW